MLRLSYCKGIYVFSIYCHVLLGSFMQLVVFFQKLNSLAFIRIKVSVTFIRWLVFLFPYKFKPENSFHLCNFKFKYILREWGDLAIFSVPNYKWIVSPDGILCFIFVQWFFRHHIVHWWIIIELIYYFISLMVPLQYITLTLVKSVWLCCNNLKIRLFHVYVKRYKNCLS